MNCYRPIVARNILGVTMTTPWNSLSVSKSLSPVTIVWAWPPTAQQSTGRSFESRNSIGAASSAGGPGRIKPETRTLVSATTLTAGATFGADGVHLGLNFVHGHRFIRMGSHLFHHLAELPHGPVKFDFPLHQLRELLRIKQTFGPGRCGHGLGEIQLNGDAHDADKMPARSASCQTGADLAGAQ